MVKRSIKRSTKKRRTRSTSKHSDNNHNINCKSCPRCVKCTTCDGAGIRRKVKKDGNYFQQIHKCSECKGDGVLLTATEKVAGFKIPIRTQKNINSNGGIVSEATLQYIADRNTGRVKEFLQYLIRFRQVSKYLSTFVEGIKTYVKQDDMLHPHFSQTNVVTGRLSCSEPNFQNIPRKLVMDCPKKLLHFVVLLISLNHLKT